MITVLAFDKAYVDGLPLFRPPIVGRFRHNLPLRVCASYGNRICRRALSTQLSGPRSTAAGTLPYKWGELSLVSALSIWFDREHFSEALHRD